MKSKKTFSIFIFTLVLLSTGCSDSPFSPPGETNPPPGSKTTFGLVEVTITGIGTENMKASAKPAGQATAFSFTDPQNADNSGNGSIQMEAISNGSFTTGTRGVDGMRYIYATFKVRNAEIGGDNYDTPRENLTFMAVDFTNTIGHTAVVSLRLFDGTPIVGSQAADMAKTIIPTGKVAYKNGEVTPIQEDVLQILTETEAANITAIPGVDVFPYGFITRSPNTTGSSRELPDSPGPNDYDGLATFAFKMPLEAQANQDPFEITMQFLPVDDNQVRLTQSLEEQSVEASFEIASRLRFLQNALYATLLPGSNFSYGPLRRICGPVRIAGSPPPAIPTAVLFPAPPVLQSISPDPYGGTGHKISETALISATYDKALQDPSRRNFAIHPAQSGGVFYVGYTNSGTTVTPPPDSYFPGELVEVTFTSGLGSCLPTVVRYRVVPTLANGPFTTSTINNVGAGPEGVAAVDWDSDGLLDIVVANSGGDEVILYTNDGSGGFLKSTKNAGNNPDAVKAADLNGDGRLELAVVNESDNKVTILQNNIVRYIDYATVSVGNFPREITSGDWDGDGDNDLAVANRVDDTISLLFNHVSNAFTEITYNVGNAPRGIIAGDWNQDGDLDLAVTNESHNTISLLTNDGIGTYAYTGTILVGNNPGPITAGDWNADGKLDLAVANGGDDTVNLLKGDGSGGFSPFTPNTVTVGDRPFSIITADWNGDGNLDLVVANIDDDTVSLLANNGSGSFTVTSIPVGNNPVSVAAGDWSGDDKIDLAVANFGDNTITLLTNQ